MLRDPIEQTSEYQEAMKKIDPILRREFPKGRWMMGTCYPYWARKKALLQEHGVEWKSPAEMNPRILFD